MSTLDRILAVTVDDLRLGFHLANVERVVRAVEITRIPDAPPAFCGAIEVAGEIIPVLDLRRRLGLPLRDLRLSDHFVIVRVAVGLVALVVDCVGGVVEIPVDAVRDENDLLKGLPHTEGVVKLADGLIVIHDAERFVLPTEEKGLMEALNQFTAHE